MASKKSASLALFLALNLLFFTLTTAKCPKDTVKLGVCANVLKGLVNVKVGEPPVKPCCSLVKDLVDIEAAACLCSIVKANVVGIELTIPVFLNVLLNNCGRKVPSGFQCA